MDVSITDTDATTAGTPAPYGRACTNCARAKCRCIYRTDDDSCERCHRLKKECVPSVTVRKRNGRRANGSRTAQLEEKLEDLVSLLRNQAAKGSRADDTLLNLGIATPSPSSHSTSQSHFVESPRKDSDSACPENAKANPQPCAFGQPAVAQKSADAVLMSLFEPKPPDTPSLPSLENLPTTAEAEASLDIFRQQMLYFFPFVYIPPTTTAQDLRKDRPFFWYTIMTVTCKSATRQLVMSTAIREHIGKRIVIECEKSLDLLLGLLVYIGWSHHHKKDRPYLTVMASLMQAMVFDLVLNKLPGDLGHILCFRPAAHDPCPKTTTAKTRTLEERRIVLSVYFLTCIISFDMRKLEPLSWTPYMDECIQVLSQEAECVGDKVLVQLVKLQKFIDQINRAPWQPRDSSPPPMYVEALQARLQSLKNSMPVEIANHEVITQSHIYTELIILETVLLKDPNTMGNPDFGRYSLLENSLDLLCAYFDGFFSLSDEIVPGMTFSFWCQMAHCLMTLSWLSIRESPSWCADIVRKRLDLIQVCDRMQQMVGRCGEKRRLESGIEVEDDIFARSEKVIGSMREIWQAELRSMSQPSTDASTSGVDPGIGDPKISAGFMDGITTGPLAMPMSQYLADDPWLTDIFNVSWE